MCCSSITYHMYSYLEAYNLVRSITGIGEGKGPMIGLHEGFQGLDKWVGFIPNADRLALDIHVYFAFAQTPSNQSLADWASKPCPVHQAKFTNSNQNFGPTNAGEWSLAINDCGLNVNGVGDGTRFEGTYVGNDKPAAGTCPPWNEWETWTDDTKAGLKQFALVQMDALQVRRRVIRSFSPNLTLYSRTTSSGRGRLATRQRSTHRVSAHLSGLTS